MLDGSEGWGIGLTGTANYYYRYRYITGALYHSGTDNWINNLATPNSIGTSNTEQGGYLTNSGELRIRYGAEMLIADWRTFLSNNNMIVCYVLADTTETKITDSDLIDQLEALLAKHTLYEGVNNIFLIPGATPDGTLTLGYIVYDKYNHHKVYIWNDTAQEWQIIVQ